MTSKTKKQNIVHLKLRYGLALQDRIRKYRAQRLLANEKISSDEKAAIQLIERGLEAEIV